MKSYTVRAKYVDCMHTYNNLKYHWKWVSFAVAPSAHASYAVQGLRSASLFAFLVVVCLAQAVM